MVGGRGWEKLWDNNELRGAGIEIESERLAVYDRISIWAGIMRQSIVLYQVFIKAASSARTQKISFILKTTVIKRSNVK